MFAYGRTRCSNECVTLPIAHRNVFVDGLTLEELLKHPIFSGQLKGYVFQAGQPEEIRRAYEDAMGTAPFRLPENSCMAQ